MLRGERRIYSNRIAREAVDEVCDAEIKVGLRSRNRGAEVVVCRAYIYCRRIVSLNFNLWSRGR